MSEQTVQRLDRMIKARYPIIALLSYEEDRALQSVRSIARAQGKDMVTWTISAGFAGLESEDGAQYADPISALQYIVSAAPEQGRLWVLQDLHHFCNELVQRYLRDIARALINRRETVVLLSPQFQVPTDLEKDIAIVDFPLPTADELERQIDAFIDGLPAGIECQLNGNRQELIRALQGLTALEADTVLSEALVAHRHLDTDALPFILNAKAAIIRQSGALEYYPEQASYTDIGGLDLLTAWATETESAYTAEAQAYGIEPPRGVLIVGVPGCGKSLTAKAIAGGKRPLLRLDVGALFGSLVGQSEAQTRNALQIAEAVAPCVLWVDEIEKALGSSGGEMDGGTSVRVLGTILTWMQETTAPVFLVATANDIAHLRPELIRRFTEVFFVDLPQQSERADILAIHLSKRGRDPQQFDLAAVAGATNDFTGSELEKVVQGALRRAFADGKREIATDDLLSVATDTVPLARTMQAGIAQMREWASRARPASSRQAAAAVPPARAIEL